MINEANLVPLIPRSKGGCNSSNQGAPQKKQLPQSAMVSVSRVKYRLNPNTGRYELAIPCLEHWVGEFALPRDSQYIIDAACLEVIVNVLSQRYNTLENMVKPTHSINGQNVYNNIFFVQVDISRYEFYLPNEICVGWVVTPPDMQYAQDLTVIKEICKALANRFCLI